MKTTEINALRLSIGDLISVRMIDFYYRIVKKDDKLKVEESYSKREEPDWINCPIMTGTYCGDNYNQDGEMKTFKFRVTEPITMSKHYGNYFPLAPAHIQSIKIFKKEEGITDQIITDFFADDLDNDNSGPIFFQ